jgi:hypothetical protein
MAEVMTEQKIYYIEAAGQASTIIGKHSIMPNMPPVPFTEKQYSDNKRKIKFYEEHGTIIVTEPGSRDAILKADAIRRERERMEEVFAGDETDEPDSVLRQRGHSIPEAYADKLLASRGKRKMPSFSAPSDPVDADVKELGYKCMAVTGSGKRCKKDALDDLLVCGTHKKMLAKGDVLKDASGRKISQDGKSLAD